MKLAYDARHAARGLGISTFLRSLAVELVQFDEIDLIWLGDPALAPPGVARSVPVHRLPYPVLDSPAGGALARRLGADVIHFTGNTGWIQRGPVPSVLTLHDLIFLTSSGPGRSLRQAVGHRYERAMISRAITAADLLAVPSHTVAADVVGRLGAAVAPRVVYEGVTVPRTAPAAAGGAAPYIVAFAGRDPRKRTTQVVEAWRALAPAPIKLRLLTSAGLPAGLRESLEPEIASGHAIVSGHLPRAELWAVLEGAMALVYPSSDEGFGLPVLEAMAAGTPVLTGLAPVTREIGGDAIVPLDDRDVTGSIVAAVRRLHDEPAYAAEMRARGFQQAATFTWRKTAEGYRKLYGAAAQSDRR